MPNTPLRYRPDAIATHLGWAHSLTGEQLVSARNLEADTGTETYDPNNRNWMRSYQEGGDSPTPNSFKSITQTVEDGTVTLDGKTLYVRSDDVSVDWGDASEVETETPDVDGLFTLTHVYAATGDYTITLTLGAYDPVVVETVEVTVETIDVG